MAYWTCARFELRREAVAQHFLELNGYHVYIPKLREQRKRSGRRVEAIAPLFPSYGFVAIEQQWRQARWSIGVVALIMDGERPARVPDAIISEIKSRERNGLVELPKLNGLKPGMRVRVIGGPLSEQIGMLAALRPHERVLVLLQLLGGERRVELARNAIEAV